MHSPNDISKVWQADELQTRPYLWQTAAISSSTAYVILPISRIVSPPNTFPIRKTNRHEPSPSTALFTMETGTPNPVRGGSFASWMQYETSWKPQPHDIPMSQLNVLPFAHLTGVARIHLTNSDLKSLHDYVEQGGVLLVDSCGGNSIFTVAIEAVIRPLFPVVTVPMTAAGPSGPHLGRYVRCPQSPSS